MMNKYQKALDNYSENVDYRDYSTKTVDIVNESYDTLQELVDQTKTPPLEQVKKEWEEAGWKWEKTPYFIVLEKNGVDIHLYLETKQYSCSQTSSYILDFIGIKEHQLLTKTFRALGW